MQKELSNAADVVGNYNEIPTAISSEVFVCTIYNYAFFFFIGNGLCFLSNESLFSLLKR